MAASARHELNQSHKLPKYFYFVCPPFRTFEAGLTKKSQLPPSMASATPQLERLRSIIQVQAQLTNAHLDLDAFMQQVVDSLQALTGAAGAVVELVEGEEMVYRCASPALARHLGLRLQRKSSLSGLCVERGEILYSQDTDDDLRVNRDACRSIGIRSMVCTPLYCRGEAVGVLKVMARQPLGFDEDDIQTLELLGASLGGALGRQVAFDLRMQMARRLHASEARLRAMLEFAHDAIVSMDAQGVVMEWNPAAEQLFGWSAQEAVGRSMAALIFAQPLCDCHDDGLSCFRECGHGVRPSRLELQAVHRDGREMTIELSWSGTHVAGSWEFTGFMRDITERKRLESALQALARQDALTGLLNRRAFMDALIQALHRLDRHGVPAALLFLDLDGFKQLNDTQGHQAGDEALVSVAARLRDCVRGNDVLARLGGDEFVLLADGIGEEAPARALAEKVLHAVAGARPSSGLSCSVGIALASPGSTATGLLQQADHAMYTAKQQGRGTVAVHAKGAPVEHAVAVDAALGPVTMPG